MVENSKAKSSPSQVRAVLCQSIRWRQRSLAVAQDITLQRGAGQAPRISKRASRTLGHCGERIFAENDIRRGAKDSSAKPSRRYHDQAEYAALLEPGFRCAPESVAGAGITRNPASHAHRLQGMGASLPQNRFADTLQQHDCGTAA